MLQRRRVTSDVENDILTGMVVSTPFLRKLRKWYKPEFFTDYGAIIAGWVVNYYDNHGEAPGKNIQHIYNVETDQVPLALRENLNAYLTNLNAEYENKKEFNENYLVDVAHQHFRKRAYEHLFLQGREYVMAGQLEQAVKMLGQFNDIRKQISKWENPFNPGVIQQHFFNQEEGGDKVFRFRGALGNLIGDLEVGWLVAFMGPMKRGKSFWLQESAFAAAAARKNVAIINLEMIQQGQRDREYKRIVGLPDEQVEWPILLPIFDCAHNQVGTCPMTAMRSSFNDVLLLQPGMLSKPEFLTPGTGDYRACSACRNHPDENIRQHYSVENWFTYYNPGDDWKYQGYGAEVLKKRANGFIHQYGDRIRNITYPAYTVTIEDIMADLDELRMEGFDPDVVVLDYADIVNTTRVHDSERGHLNEVWKSAKRAAGLTHTLWITATQTNRGAIGRETVYQTDIAEDIRKLAHVDAMFAINQSEREKIEGLCRISTLAHRHRKFTSAQVAVLQRLELGLTYIDSEKWTKREEKNKKGKK